MSWLRAHWEGIALVVAIALAVAAFVLWRKRETPSEMLAKLTRNPPPGNPPFIGGGGGCGPFPCR